eukprot:m.503396 g.503396  ORF g.503396 m.503396 type:complete len:153 (+) comp57346_c0_seq9:751-1209(+)
MGPSVARVSAPSTTPSLKITPTMVVPVLTGFGALRPVCSSMAFRRTRSKVNPPGDGNWASPDIFHAVGRENPCQSKRTAACDPLCAVCVVRCALCAVCRVCVVLCLSAVCCSRTLLRSTNQNAERDRNKARHKPDTTCGNRGFRPEQASHCV